ncbi:MAG: carboxymuconolactone decarboxylase family protein [Methylobacterium frigidaeris]
MTTRAAALALLGLLACLPARADQPGTRPMSGTTATTPLDDLRSAAPALHAYTEGVLLGDLWKRTDLSARDRGLVTAASLVAAGHVALMAPEFERALDAGVKPAELAEVITHLAFYAGWPRAMSAAGVAKVVFARRGVDAGQLAEAGSPLTLDAASEKARIASVEQAVGGVAPALGTYTNDVLFGDVWRRPGLSPRDRSLVTVSALITGGNTAQLVGHLNRALDNGLTRAEASAVITHLAFYAGWPNAMSAAGVAKTVFEKRPG